MVIESKFAAFTVANVLPVTEPEVAVMVALPRSLAVPKPLWVTDITELLEELHETVLVMTCIVPLEKDPVAVNCC
jgi:hypothetical protein